MDGALGEELGTSFEVGNRGSEGVGIDSCSSNALETELSGRLVGNY